MSAAGPSDKLDPYARRQLEAGVPSGGLEIAVRVTKERSGSAQEELRGAGLEVHSNVGDVVVGRVADEAALNRILTLPFVREVQVSRPLYNEAR